MKENNQAQGLQISGENVFNLDLLNLNCFWKMIRSLQELWVLWELIPAPQTILPWFENFIANHNQQIKRLGNDIPVNVCQIEDLQ